MSDCLLSHEVTPWCEFHFGLSLENEESNGPAGRNEIALFLIRLVLLSDLLVITFHEVIFPKSFVIYHLMLVFDH
jgi:hypothetical protein